MGIRRPPKLRFSLVIPSICVHIFFSFQLKTRRYGTLSRPTFSSCKELLPLAEYFSDENDQIMNHLRMFHIMDHSRSFIFWTIPEFLFSVPSKNFQVLNHSRIATFWTIQELDLTLSSFGKFKVSVSPDKL